MRSRTKGVMAAWLLSAAATACTLDREPTGAGWREFSATGCEGSAAGCVDAGGRHGAPDAGRGTRSMDATVGGTPRDAAQAGPDAAGVQPARDAATDAGPDGAVDDAGAEASDCDACVDAANCTDPPCAAGEDGEPCARDADCGSRYCSQGVCCAGGVCCNAGTPCPGAGVTSRLCDDPGTCQGSRSELACVAFRCTSIEGIPDDTACDASQASLDCGRYRPATCTGAAVQDPPRCPSACASNGDCSPTSVCTNGACVGPLANGAQCSGDGECQSAHCGAGICCDQGDCCVSDTDCFGSSQCLSASSCQGERRAPVCGVDFRCALGPAVPDDSACSGQHALDCSDYRDLRCTSATDQAPVCPSTCQRHADCDPGSHCTGGVCSRRGGGNSP